MTTHQNEPPKAKLATHLATLRAMILSLDHPMQPELLAQYNDTTEVLLSIFAEIASRDQTLKTLIQNQELNTKYVLFDLEATQRERDALRQQLYGDDNDVQE